MKYNALHPFYLRGESDGEKAKSMYRQMLMLAWPATIEGLLVSVISAVDTMMVGGLGASAIAAVGLTSQPRMILLILAQAMGVGTTALVARRKGADDIKGAQSCLNQSMAIMSFIGIVMGFFAYIFARDIMLFAGANNDTIEQATKYFRIIAFGFLPNCWQLCINSAHRAIGKTSITMVTNGVANIVNVILNYMLIMGNFGFPRMEVEGAALATIIGTYTASFIALRFASNKQGFFKYKLFNKPKFDRLTISQLITIGGGFALEAIFLRAGFLILQKIIAGIDTVAFASFQVVSQFTAISFSLGDGVSNAAVSFVGQNLGAEKPDTAQQFVYVAKRLGAMLSIIITLVTIGFSPVLPRLFTDDIRVINSASLGFIIAGLSMFYQNGRLVYAGCLRGAGDVKYVAMSSLIGVAIIRPLIAYICVAPLHGLFPHLRFNETGAWISFFADALVRYRLLGRRVENGKWLDIKLK